MNGTKLIGSIVMGFEDTFETVFQEFCYNFSCFKNYNGNNSQFGKLQRLGRILDNRSVHRIAMSALDDLKNIINPDIASGIQYMLNNATSDEVDEIIDDTIGDGWFGDLVGSFVEGIKNSGMDRKGGRDDKKKNNNMKKNDDDDA